MRQTTLILRKNAYPIGGGGGDDKSLALYTKQQTTGLKEKFFWLCCKPPNHGKCGLLKAQKLSSLELFLEVRKEVVSEGAKSGE
jgi:hypothetical protein